MYIFATRKIHISCRFCWLSIPNQGLIAVYTYTNAPDSGRRGALLLCAALEARRYDRSPPTLVLESPQQQQQQQVVFDDHLSLCVCHCGLLRSSVCCLLCRWSDKCRCGALLYSTWDTQKKETRSHTNVYQIKCPVRTPFGDIIYIRSSIYYPACRVLLRPGVLSGRATLHFHTYYNHIFRIWAFLYTSYFVFTSKYMGFPSFPPSSSAAAAAAATPADNKFSSFQRQLNLYGFRKVVKGRESGCYMHPSFLRDRPDLLSEVRVCACVPRVIATAIHMR